MVRNVGTVVRVVPDALARPGLQEPDSVVPPALAVRLGRLLAALGGSRRRRVSGRRVSGGRTDDRADVTPRRT